LHVGPDHVGRRAAPPGAEAALVGQPASAASFRSAAEGALRGARLQSENAFKIELAKRCRTQALQAAAPS
jgi:xanthine dehydrogenase YagS FAD-binding subunit